MSESASGGLGRKVVHGFIVVVFFGLFWKLGGYLMNALVFRYYSEGPVFDAFSAMYGKVFALLFAASALKMLQPAFIPLFSDRLQNRDEAEAWRLSNTVVNLLLLAAAAIATLSFIYAEQFIRICLPEFTPQSLACAVILLRWFVPGLLVVFFGIWAQGVMNSYKVFSYPAAADATQKVVWAAVFFVGARLVGAKADLNASLHLLGAAFLIGCLAQTAVLLVGLRGRLHFYRPSFPLMSARRRLVELAWLVGLAVGVLAYLRVVRLCIAAPEAWYHLKPEWESFLVLTGVLAAGCAYALSVRYRAKESASLLARFAVLMSPLVIGVLFGRHADLVNALFQSYAAEGQFGIVELAQKVVNLPTALVPYSLSIAMLPFMCDLAARRETQPLSDLVGRALRVMALVCLPLTAVTIAIPGPIMQLVWPRKQPWSAESLTTASVALGIMSTGIFFMAIEAVLMQAFFSLRKTVLPTALGIIFSLAQSFGLFVAVQLLGYSSPTQIIFVVTIAYAARRILKNLVLMLFLDRDIRLLTRKTLAFFATVLLLSAAAGASAWAAHRFVVVPVGMAGLSPRILGKMAPVILPTMVAIIVFVLPCACLRVEEFMMLVQWVRQRGWKIARPKVGGGEGEA